MVDRIPKTGGMIFTASPSVAALARDEVLNRIPNASLQGWLVDGVGLVQSVPHWEQIALSFRQKPPIFVRHICPVQSVVDPPITLERLTAEVRPIIKSLDSHATFSVQTRMLGQHDWTFRRFDVNQHLARMLGQIGTPLDVRAPVQVLSVILTPEAGYLGFSLAGDNLSDWAGGERRFKREPGQISRAEFKLLEALEVFTIELPSKGIALDLGAAPGGWTRVLLNHGLQVIAVDPSALDPRLLSQPGVTHLRTTVQAFISRDIVPPSSPKVDRSNLHTLSNLKYDLIVNDMRMEAGKAVEILGKLASRLSKDGIVISTLKLPSNRMGAAAESALVKLQPQFEILGARQLFHNRHEITIQLQKRAQTTYVLSSCV